MKRLHLKSTPSATSTVHGLSSTSWHQHTNLCNNQALVLSGAAAAMLLSISPPALAEGPSIPACVARASCVSTSSFLSPSNYLAPWMIEGQSIEAAQRQLVQEIEAQGGNVLSVEHQPGGIYMQARLPGGSGSQVDQVEFLFRDNVLLFRSQAIGASTAPPPACWTPGCISGPPQRARMEQLRNRLGWLSGETDEEKQWVQILLH